MALSPSDSTPPSSAGSFVSSTVTSAPGAAQPHTAARAGALWSTALDPRNVGSLSELGRGGDAGATGDANVEIDTNAATRTRTRGDPSPRVRAIARTGRGGEAVKTARARADQGLDSGPPATRGVRDGEATKHSLLSSYSWC